MALLTVDDADLTGVTPSFVAADAGGDDFPNDGKTYLHVKNDDAVDHTVTVNSQQTCNQGFDHDVEVEVPAGSEKVAGPFSKHRFDDSSDRVQVSYDDVTSVSVAAVSV